ncbi:MAG: sugar phosphate isomerase/epimerase [Lachnospiraceae bacterium]|nr:sugar phosphate isomerase/epimerase [Lachnospiraceae bacterium]MBQ8233739.1 sugar phosphate isomerase/epimerase [Lachnospiraceae bacterium]
MNRLVFSAYAINYREYDRLKKLLDACSFANMGAELNMFTKTSSFPEFMDELATVSDKFAPYYVTFHGPFKELEATSPLDSEAHAIMVEGYKQAFQFCKDFSAHGIVMHTNEKIQLTDENSALKNNCIATIKEIGEIAQTAGVKLQVENVGFPLNKNVLFPMEDFIQLFDEIPDDIGCLIDVGHAFANNWDLAELIKRLGTRITSYHIHNNDGVHDSHRMIFEEGLYYSKEDWKKLFVVMEKYSPDADWILEYSPKNDITVENVVGEVKEILAMLDMTPKAE